MVRRRKVVVGAYNNAPEDGGTPLGTATGTYDNAQEERVRKTVVNAYDTTTEDRVRKPVVDTYDKTIEDRVRKPVVDAYDKASESEDGVLIPLESVVYAYDKAPEEGVSFEAVVNASDKAPVNRARKTVGDAYDKSPEDGLLVPFETVVDACDKAPVSRVWETVGDAYEKTPEDGVLNPLEAVDDAYDKTPEDGVLNPLKAVDDAYDTTPEDGVLNPLKAVDDAYEKASEEGRKRIRVILVMGLTGTGKSTFIKTLTNDHSIIIGDDLHSQTVEVSLSKLNFFASDHQSYDVYFADTPGFDDSSRSDTDVLKNIVYWLGAMREKSIKLSGIIYLHRITDTRVGGLAWRNLRMLQKLVGVDKMANVLLVSTRWEEQPLTGLGAWRTSMEKRQKQLEQGYVDRIGKRQPGFWQVYIQEGARVMRHDGSIESARRIVDNIITRSKPIYIQIQDEVHAGKDLSQTAAGQAIKTDLEKVAEKTKEELSNLKVEMEDALKKAKEDEDRLKQQYEEQMSLLGQRMATESEEQRVRMEEELSNLKREMGDSLKSEKEQHERLREQYGHEKLSEQERLRKQYEEERLRKQYEEERLRKQAEQERLRKQYEEERLRQQAEEKRLRKQYEEERLRQQAEQERLRKQYEQEISLMQKTVIDNAEKQRQLLEATREEMQRAIRQTQKKKRWWQCSIM